MSNDIIKKQNYELTAVEQALMQNDLSKLTTQERKQHYDAVCDSLGLNPLTSPFSYLNLQGKITFYATRSCTEQLRKIHGVSCKVTDAKKVDDIYVVTVEVKDKYGREDCSTGAVNIGGLKGDMMANALMKAETKAKRRATLSICGLAFMDETEIETVQGAKPIPHNAEITETKTVAKMVDDSQIKLNEMNQLGKIFSMLTKDLSKEDKIKVAKESLGVNAWAEVAKLSVDKIKSLKVELEKELQQKEKIEPNPITEIINGVSWEN